MFKRKKSRVAPQTPDAYILRRYKDLAVCINMDINNDRGLFCYYTPWLDYMMEKFNFSEDLKKRNTLVVTDSQGKHIGCSGAVHNTLVYHNPISIEHLVEPSLPQREKTIVNPSKKEEEHSIESNEHSHVMDNVILVSPVQERVIYKKASEKVCEENTKSSDDPSVEHLLMQQPSKVDDLVPEEASGGNLHVQNRNETLIEHVSHVNIITEPPNSSDVPELKETSRPQTADSYYARIDEAFCKHRAGFSKATWKEPEMADHHKPETKPVCTEIIHKNNSSSAQTGRSKFCTIL